MGVFLQQAFLLTFWKASTNHLALRPKDVSLLFLMEERRYHQLLFSNALREMEICVALQAPGIVFDGLQRHFL